VFFGFSKIFTLFGKTFCFIYPLKYRQITKTFNIKKTARLYAVFLYSYIYKSVKQIDTTNKIIKN